jgi:AcrR family transcriptional regulator
MSGSGSTTAAATGAPKQRNRSVEVLAGAARLFNAHGLEGASMRDIAATAGIRSSSLYHFFPSKQQLFETVHREGVRRISETVEQALENAPVDDPWSRLERAAAAHLESLLAGDDFTSLVIRTVPPGNSSLPPEITRLRNDYETIFRNLIDELPDSAGLDRRLLRLMLLGALNSATNWYRADGPDRPADMACRLVGWLRHGIAEGDVR